MPRGERAISPGPWAASRLPHLRASPPSSCPQSPPALEQPAWRRQNQSAPSPRQRGLLTMLQPRGARSPGGEGRQHSPSPGEATPQHTQAGEAPLPAASLGRSTRASPESGQEVRRGPWKGANRRRAGGAAAGSYPELARPNDREKLLGGGAVAPGRAGLSRPKLSEVGKRGVGAFVAVRRERGAGVPGGACFCSALY